MKTNKLFKILLCVIIGLVMAFSAAACSSNSGNGSGDNGDDNTETVTGIDMVATLSIDIDQEYTLQPVLLPFGATATITWRSSDTDVVTVSNSGVVKGISAGKAIVRATAGGKSANCTVTVTDPAQMTVPVSSVTFNIGVLDLQIGDTPTLTATVKPDNATNPTLTWSSSKPAVATVSQMGAIVAVGGGNTVITATSVSNPAVKATCVVKVAGESSGGDTETTTDGLYVKKVDSLADRDDFIMGMDASEVISVENARKASNSPLYKNFDGEEEDVFKILKDNGITDIRIRIWNDPYVTGHSGEQAYSYGGGNCDVNNAVEISRRCEAVGLGVIIDFHYSDFWADPGKQVIPKAWKNLSTSDVAKEIYDFTEDSLQKIKETGVKITMVQIGNETTGSMAGSSDWTVICNYFNQGSAAVRAVTGAVKDGGAKVAVHFTNAGSNNYESRAQTLKNNNVDYDVFGTSWYPYYASHGTLSNLASQLKSINKNYGKEVMVLETAYAFTYEDFDGLGNTSFEATTHPITEQGMSNSVRDVIETIADLGDYGLGVCYWGGIWIAASSSTDRATNQALCREYGSGWATAKASEYDSGANDGGTMVDNNAFFYSDSGEPLQALKVFKYAKEGHEIPLAADYIYTQELYYTVDEDTIELPQKVTVVLNDGSTSTVAALWAVDITEVAEYIHTVNDYVITGTTEFGGVAICNIYVQNKNLLTDGGFEDSAGYASADNTVDVPSPWQARRNATGHVLQLYVSNKQADAEMGNNTFHFWDDVALDFDLYQTLTASAISAFGYGSGTYTFSIDFAGGDCGDTQDIYSYAKITYTDGSTVTVKGTKIYATGWKQWSRSSVDVVIDGSVASIEVGIHVSAEAGGWGNMDNAQFFFKN